MSHWKDKLQRYLDDPPFSSKKEFEEQARYGPNEPGITHPTNKSTIKIRDDAAIDIFADEDLGIRLDPNNKSINFFCDKFNVWSNQTLIHTESDNFLWNYWPLNPFMYQMMPWNMQIQAKYQFFDQDYGMWRTLTTSFQPFLSEEKWSDKDRRFINNEQGVMKEIFEDAVKDYGPIEEDLEPHPTGNPNNPEPGEGFEWR